MLALSVLQEWGQTMPNISFTCTLNLISTFGTKFSKSVEHNCMLPDNASAQIQPFL